MNWYSQNGEDFYAALVLPETGFFVDVGALDGKRFSNTLAFAERGWKGICVEAHPAYADMCGANRPDAEMLNVAVGAEDRASVVFNLAERGTFSSLDPKMAQRFKDCKCFTGYKQTMLEMKTLDSILADRAIDFVTIDTEGTEVDVLCGFNINKYRPVVVVVEFNSKRDRKIIDQYMCAQGYVFARALGANVIYCRDKCDALKIRGVKMTAKLIHTTHPLDEL